MRGGNLSKFLLSSGEPRVGNCRWINDDDHNQTCQALDDDRHQCIVASFRHEFTVVDMKVTKAQAQANRAHVVETASTLFREHGYDGVGVADLMAAAGFTHGGFYKQFGSKADLIAESTACGIAQTLAMSEGVGPVEFVQQYLSREHRDARATGCTMAALGGDTARQPEAVRVAFAAGVEDVVAALTKQRAAPGSADAGQARAQTLDALAHAVGALVMSRACPDDSPLADEFLAVCRNALLASAAPEAARRKKGTGRHC